MDTRKLFDQWQKEITEENKRTPVYIKCDCGNLALKAYRKELFQCPNCLSKYNKEFKKMEIK